MKALHVRYIIHTMQVEIRDALKSNWKKPRYIQKKKTSQVSKFFAETMQITRHWSSNFKYKKKKEILKINQRLFLMYT